MKHTYHIHGMTCNGCRSHVEKTLSDVKGVSNVTVNLENAEATIEMESHIAIGGILIKELNYSVNEKLNDQGLLAFQKFTEEDGSYFIMIYKTNEK